MRTMALRQICVMSHLNTLVNGKISRCKCSSYGHQIKFSWAKGPNRQFSSGSNGPQNFKVTSYIAIVSGLSCILLGTFYYQRKKSKVHQPILETHSDIHCKGSSGTLVKYGKFWLPQEFINKKEKLKEISQFEIRDGDVIVASFPKSGTTWVQEIVYLVLNDLDLNKTTKLTIEERFPYIEYIYPGLKHLAKIKEPRCLKTHLPFEYLPIDVYERKHGKVIYIARNPKDVAVSYYHFVRMLSVTKYFGTFSDFHNSFLEGKVPYGPWDLHVLHYWMNHKSENMLFITYEELHQTPEKTVQRIAAFLGKSLTDKQIEAVIKHTSFNNMRTNPMVNYSWWQELGIANKMEGQFMRKGKIGDWKNYFTEEMNAEMENTFVRKTREYGLAFHDES